MAEEHIFSAEVSETTSQTEKRRTWKSCLTGCLIVAVILTVISVLFGVWAYANWRSIVANIGTSIVTEMVHASKLPQEEKQEIMLEVERVSRAVRDGSMTIDQMGKLATTFSQSPLMTMVIAMAIEQEYIAKSGLTADDKAIGGVTLSRFIRGTLDGKIDESGFDAAMAHVADRDSNGTWKLRQKIKDDHLVAFLAEAKKQADEAGIPEQPAAIDPSEEVKRIVDEALNVPAPPESEPVAAPVSE